MTNTMSPIIMKLRTGTEDLHKAIEGVMPIFRPDFDLEQYRNILAKFYGFHAAFEARLGERLSPADEALAYEERRKLALIKRDLSFFHSEPEIAALPHCDKLPDCEDAAAALGALYVIEGSTLGGQVITAHLQKMGVPQEARNYFSGYGEKTGKMWKQFQSVLGERVRTPEDIQSSVKSARHTFSCLHEWLAS